MTGKAIDGSDSYSYMWSVAVVDPTLRCIGARNWVGEPVAGSRQCTVCLAHAVKYLHTLRRVPLVPDPRLSS